MEYSKSFIVISKIFTASPPRADSFQETTFFTPIRNSSSGLKFYHEIAKMHSGIQVPFLFLVLLLFPETIKLPGFMNRRKSSLALVVAVIFRYITNAQVTKAKTNKWDHKTKHLAQQKKQSTK